MQPAPGYGPPTGERWNVNMPAVIGVVFVFLVGVIVWVVATADDDGAASGASTSAPTTSVGSTPATSVPGVAPVDSSATTSPTPLPTTVPATTTTSTPPTTAASTAAPTSTAPAASTTLAPATTAPGADPDSVPGDLAIAGRPMQRPACNGSYITILASAIGEQASAVGIEAVLDDYPGANYLRTDQTCPSLNASVDGQPIYVVYFGPFGDDEDACDARADGPDGAYARLLSDDVGPDHSVPCPSAG